MNIRKLYIAMLLISPVSLALSADDHNKNTSLTHVISDYRMSLASLPLDYGVGLGNGNYCTLGAFFNRY